MDSKYVYSVECADGIKISFLGQDMGYSDLALFFPPQTYYVSVEKDNQVIGYGAIESGCFKDPDTLLVAFRMFREYRGQSNQSKMIFRTVLSSGRQLFGNDIRKFVMSWHQLNTSEGIDSGAVLFYLKLGFEFLSENLQKLWDNDFKRKLAFEQRLSSEEVSILAQGYISFELDNWQIPESPVACRVLSRDLRPEIESAFAGSI